MAPEVATPALADEPPPVEFEAPPAAVPLEAPPAAVPLEAPPAAVPFSALLSIWTLTISAAEADDWIEACLIEEYSSGETTTVVVVGCGVLLNLPYLWVVSVL